MHNCAFCKNPLQPWTQWKGDDTSKTSKMTQTTALPQ
jgi:hypothetical protein